MEGETQRLVTLTFVSFVYFFYIKVANFTYSYVQLNAKKCTGVEAISALVLSVFGSNPWFFRCFDEQESQLPRRNRAMLDIASNTKMKELTHCEESTVC